MTASSSRRSSKPNSIPTPIASRSAWSTRAATPVQVVCGAPNARTGMKSVFSPVGTYIPGKKMTLAKGVIRGVEFERHAVLGRRARTLRRPRRHHRTARRRAVGVAYARFAGLDDPVVDVAVTPNRPDATGVAGIARDLAAAGLGTLKDAGAEAFRRRLRLPDPRPSRFRARRRASLPRFRAAARARRDQWPFAGMDAEATDARSA